MRLNESQKYLVWLAVTSAVAGLIDGFFPESETARRVARLHSFLICVLVWAWCGMHALEHGHGTGGGYRLFAALLPPVGIPAYLVKYFGWRGGVRRSVKALGFFVLMVLCYLAPFYGVLYVRA